jgi:hypothetical protein
MPQRFTPDGYITQCLVTDADAPFGEGVPGHPLPYLGNREPRPFTWGFNKYMNPPEARFMPRGLDVMAVFDCAEALEILKSDGDAEYAGYDSMLAFLRKDVGQMTNSRKGENLYYAWLDALQPMMKPIPSDHVAQDLKATTILPPGLREKVLSRKTDSQMAVIADVHTDTNAGKVLEEGVGTPFLLTVQMPLRGKSGRLTEFHGAVFSYYEFKQPMSERLTDEAWQEMLADPSKRPSLPSWAPAEQ